ncbi:sensor histidine kinase [Cupriavidus necator]
MFSKPLRDYRKELGFRLTLWFCVFFILGTLCLFALAYFLLATSLREQDRNSVDERLGQLAAQYQATDLTGLRSQLAREARLRSTKPFFIRIAGPQNTTVFMEIPDQWAEFDLDHLEHAPLADPAPLIRLPAKDDEAMLEIVSRRLPGGSLLQVGKSTEERDSFLERFVWAVAGVAVPVFLLGLLGGSLMAVRALRPIRELIQTVRAIDAGAMDARVPLLRTGDELDELGTLFNAMLNKIAALVRGMREALDNVAHDLRTPVARIRGTAEAALRSEPKLEVCREALADCVEESDQLLRMLNTIMDISEAETGAMRLDLVVVNLSPLIDEAVELYQYLAEEKAITVSATMPQSVRVMADRNRLRQVLSNLLDNAIKYTNPGGNVTVSVALQDQAVAICVTDTGIGMNPDDLSRIWDRLYRSDRSRSQRGLGLGLSLVKAIVEAHHGRVEASSALAAGSTFRVFLPTAPVDDR